MDRFPELQILISEKKRESSFINKKEALKRGLLFLCLYLGSMTVRNRPMVISSGAACRYGADGKRSHDTLSREISCRNAARTMRGGDFSTLWRLCIESPSQPKLASSLHNKRLSYWRLTGFRQNDGGCGPAFLKSAAKPPPPPFEPFESSVPCYAVAPKSC